MPRSSESVAALAGALAKAQAELINPEKSLVGTLPAERGQPERTFRYASLAGGLEIVRKTLGQHEIATIQTTAIDRDSGTIKLTTTLAHASGEWIASDWPVCALVDLPTPQRMGAALTYARRYALFTLVGIAGEDDLDAPDLPLQSAPPVQNPSPPLSPSLHGKTGKSNLPKPVVILDKEASGVQRDELLIGVAALSSFDAAAEWAKRVIPLKNTLTAEHARELETALGEKLAQAGIAFDGSVETSEPFSKDRTSAPKAEVNPPPKGADVITSRSLVEFEDYAVTPKTRRRRDKRHRQFVAAQACVICGRQPSDAHHLRFAQPRGLGLKVSDEFTVPLCRSHHRNLHRTGNEMGWWAQFGIQPRVIAYKLWTTTHPVSQATNNQSGPGIETERPIPEPVIVPKATTDTSYETKAIQAARHDVA